MEKIDITHFKQEPGLVQSVESETEILMKEEIVENSSERDSEQQCASTAAGTGSFYAANSTSQSDWIDVKPKLEHMDIGPTILQHMDIHYAFNTSPVDGCNEAMQCSVVKNKLKDDSKQQCAQDASIAAGACSLYEANDLSHGDCLIVKQELEDIDIGPTILQHMDIHYALNKNTVEYCNRTMPYNEVNKSVEDELRDCLTPQKAMTKKRSHVIKSLPLKIHEHYLAALCRVRVMRLAVFQCDLCDEVHTEKCRLLQHLQTMHKCRPRTSLFVKNTKTNKRTAAGNKIKCKYCGQTTTHYDKVHLKYCLGQQKDLQQHHLRQQLTTSSNCFRGEACSKTFLKPHLLSAHRKLHERNRATSSSVAGPSNARRSKAAKTEPKPFKCSVCDQGYSSKASLSSHKRFHSGVGLFVCHICRTKFNSKSNLTIHLRTHTGEKPYQCDTCNARFARKDQLTMHKRVHSGEKPYQCDTCNARFTQASNLTIHKRVHTGNKPYQCNTCNVRFARSYQLTTHKRVHSGEKPYQCDTCNAWFTQASNLTIHKRVHSGEKPYQCDTCNAWFAQASKLKIHERVHSGVKPYQCDTCNARFTTNGNLTIHKRVHTGNKPYQCGTCNARFITNSTLTVHKRVHTGEKPFECTECGYKFTRNIRLKTHIRRHHRK